MSTWKLTVNSLTGHCCNVKVPNTATGLVVKEAISRELKDPELLPHLQRLVGPESAEINDDSKLSECNIRDGTTLNLVILTPLYIYVQGVDGKNHTVTVNSEMCTVSELRMLIGKTLHHDMKNYQLYHLGCAVDEIRQGSETVLKDYSIKPGSVLVTMKKGLVLNVQNAMADVCFLVDCTASMGPHIKAVKNNIQQLRDKLQKEYTTCDLVFSFVRYTDFDITVNRTSYLPFTSDPVKFRDFVHNQIAAHGGKDYPEDIMGGLNVALNELNWRSDSCKIMIHITDAPCHGNQYHSFRDNFPNGDPNNITHENMMKQIVELDVQYWFGYVEKKYTDQMIAIFNECLQTLSQQCLIIRQFNAKDCEELGEAVQRSVISSVYGKAALKARDFTLITDLPDWNSPLIIEERAKKTPQMKSLSDIHDTNIVTPKPTIDFEFKIAPNPFIEGSECYVYYASDLIDFRRIVLKLLKENDTLDGYMQKMKNRVLSTAYAHAFSMEKLKPQNTCAIDFIQLNIIESAGIYYMLEPWLKGELPKPDTDDGSTVCPYSDLLESFSHYTWVTSGKTLLISGLKGFKKKLQDKIVLTDPTIHSKGGGGKYGPMDCGNEAIQSFFESHTCSKICMYLSL